MRSTGGALFRRQVIATRHADCGSCLKLAIDMAVEAGVPLAAIRQLLLGSGKEARPEMQLAARYVGEVLDNDPALPAVIESARGAGGSGDSPGVRRHRRPVLSPVQTRAGTRKFLRAGDGVVNDFRC